MVNGPAKRFWDKTTTTESRHGFGVALDGRDVRTPAKAPLAVPTLALARGIADEWDAQTDRIDPTAMPLTRTANSAIDKVMPQKQEVVEMLAAYGDADLLCYRAETPEGLVQNQTEIWDPLLAWAAKEIDLHLTPRFGVIHQPQTAKDTARMLVLVDQFPAFELAAFHDLVTLSGSLIIGLAACHDYQTNSRLWDASRIDENWQNQQWGEDEDDAQKVAVKKQAFLDAEKFFRLLDKK